MDIKCEACQEGISFGCSCWHCQTDWKDKFIEEIKENGFNEDDIFKRLGWIEEEIEQNYKRVDE